MFITELATSKPNIRLIKPDVERDAPLSVEWLADPHGRETLRLMGVADVYNQATNIGAERARVRGFIKQDNQYNWAIELDTRVVGAVWLDRERHEHVPAPSVHIMVGDPSARGHGVGMAAVTSVLQWAFSDGGYDEMNSRYLTSNQASQAMLSKLGFKLAGSVYTDEDKLEWQNVKLAKEQL